MGINYGIFLIMGNAGFIPSTVGLILGSIAQKDASCLWGPSRPVWGQNFLS